MGCHGQFVRLHAHVCMCVVCVYVAAMNSICLCLRAHLFVCGLYVFTWLCTYMYMHVICASVTWQDMLTYCTHTYIHMHLYVHVQLCTTITTLTSKICLYTARMHTYIHAYAYITMHNYHHSYCQDMDTYCIHTYIHTYIHSIYMYMYDYDNYHHSYQQDMLIYCMHACIHTCICIYMYMYNYAQLSPLFRQDMDTYCIHTYIHMHTYVHVHLRTAITTTAYITRTYICIYNYHLEAYTTSRYV